MEHWRSTMNTTTSRGSRLLLIFQGNCEIGVIKIHLPSLATQLTHRQTQIDARLQLERAFHFSSVSLLQDFWHYNSCWGFVERARTRKDTPLPQLPQYWRSVHLADQKTRQQQNTRPNYTKPSFEASLSNFRRTTTTSYAFFESYKTPSYTSGSMRFHGS